MILKFTHNLHVQPPLCKRYGGGIVKQNSQAGANRKVKSAPSSGNRCDRRLWRIKGASVGAAVDFVRRSKPHKQNRDTARGQ